MRQLAYMSEAKVPVTRDDLDQILTVSRSRNPAESITGFLTFDGAYFFQLLEGPAENVEALYKRVQKDPRHRITLVDRLEGPRLLPSWAMHYEQYDKAAPFVRETIEGWFEVGARIGAATMKQLVFGLKLRSSAT